MSGDPRYYEELAKTVPGYDDSPLLKYTPVFTQFMSANEALLDCYQAVDLEAYKSMSAVAQKNVCIKEKTTIRNILENNQLNMTQVVTDRVNVLFALNKRGMHTISHVRELD